MSEKRDKLFGGRLIFYIRFSLIGLFAAATSSILADSQTIPETYKKTINDQFSKEDISNSDWLGGQMKNYLLLSDRQRKLSNLKAELALTDDQMEHIADLLQAVTTEDMYGRGLANDEEYENPSEKYNFKYSDSIERTKERYENSKIETLQQVERTRKSLGPKDIDFRFWFYSEDVIYSVEESHRMGFKPEVKNDPVSFAIHVIQTQPEYQAYSEYKDKLLGKELAERYLAKKMELI